MLDPRKVNSHFASLVYMHITARYAGVGSSKPPFRVRPGPPRFPLFCRSIRLEGPVGGSARLRNGYDAFPIRMIYVCVCVQKSVERVCRCRFNFPLDLICVYMLAPFHKQILP